MFAMTETQVLTKKNPGLSRIIWGAVLAVACILWVTQIPATFTSGGLLPATMLAGVALFAGVLGVLLIWNGTTLQRRR